MKRWLWAGGVVVSLVVAIGLVRLHSDDGPATKPIHWHLADGSSAAADARSVDIQFVPDPDCDGGVGTRARLRPPEIVYGPATIVIRLSVTVPGPGFVTCARRLESELLTIQLGEPIGARTLVDGSP